MEYSSFILPFLLGAIILFIILIYKFLKWFKNFEKKQKHLILKNFFSKKTIKAIIETFREALIHRNIYKRNFLLGYMHMSLAFGWFLLIVVGKMEASFYSGTLFEEPWLAIFFKYFARENHDFWGAEFFSFTMDLLLSIVLSGLFLAFAKRIKSKILGIKKTTKHIIYDKIALSALWLIFPLRLLAESSSSAVVNNGNFLTANVGALFSNNFAQIIELPLWWAYSFSLCLFFITLPFSRYMHIPTEVVLIFLKNWGIKNNEQKSGLTDFEINSCSRCGICIDICQLNFAANIENVQSVYFLRDTRYSKLKESVLNNCLMCGRCTQACPVGLELTLIRKQMRTKNENSNKSYYDYCNINNTINKKVDVIYFAGCMTHLTPSIIQSMKNIFAAANQNYWFIDEDKGICCGRPLRQQGFIKQSNELIRKNSKLINSSNAKLLVCSCPICYKSFKEEYNLDIEILHHSEYIKMLLENNLIKLKKSNLNLIYHDPCELGRGANIYEQPRYVLNKIGKLNISDYEKENSLCCGGSLANIEIDSEIEKKIKNNSLEILLKSNPDILVTACPLCKKTFNNYSKGKAMDIAEIVSNFLYLQTNNFNKKQQYKELELYKY